MAQLGHNRICNIEDFENPELVAVIRDVFAGHLPLRDEGYPRGFEENKIWEVAMAVRALRAFGALRPDARILGVGAGLEATSFYLTNYVAQVFATDRYAGSREWDHYAPAAMITAPESLAPSSWNPQRLVVQHMDGRRLRYPDQTFDGIYSSGSIEHFGDFTDVAQAVYEMGRVLKPGGVLAISTEALVSGPEGHIGWPHQTLLFSRPHLDRYIIEASGLELVDELDLHVTPATLAITRHLHDLLETADRIRWFEDDGTPTPEYRALFPQGPLQNDGACFASVHLTLRKPSRATVATNRWAAPTDDRRDAIRAFDVGISGIDRPDPPHALDLAGRLGAVRPGGSATAPRFNRTCDVDDFSDADMAATIARVCAHHATIRRPGYPHRYESSADWALAMSARAIARHCHGRDASRALVVGAGTSPLIYDLTRIVRQVFAADEYLTDPGGRAPRSMLVDPVLSAPYAFDERRLVVQTMPITSLRFPDASFDVVVAPVLARTDVGLEDVERAVREIARVLEHGGLAVLSFLFRLSESDDRVFADLPQQLLSASEIQRHVIDAAGLVPIDPPDWSVSPRTLATRRPWRDVLSVEERLAVDTPIAPGAPPLRQLFPQIVLEHRGVMFTTVHLALERPAAVPSNQALAR